MKKSILISIFLLFATTVFSQWTLDAILPNDSSQSPFIQQVCIVDSSVSWALGRLYMNPNYEYPYFAKRTANGWRMVSHDLNLSVRGRCIAAIDSQNIWLGTVHPQEIYYSSNGGANWILQYHIADTGHVGAIMFDKQNPKTGYAFTNINFNGMGSGVRILKTTNSGQNWILWEFEYYGFIHADRSIAVIDSNHAWFGVDNLLNGPEKIIRTSNGGVNWILTDVDEVYGGPYSIQFSSDKQTGLYMGQNNPTGWIYRTTNAGNNWNIVYTTSYYYSQDMRWVPGTSNIYGCSEFVLIRSIDNGITWITMTGGPNTNLRSMDAIRINSGTIYALAVTYDRKVYKLLDTARVIGIENPGTTIPKEFKMNQNFPNPFNPVTSIKYTIPKNGNVSLMIYDALGQLITTLVNEYQTTGEYEVSFNGENYPSGVYFYKLESGDFVSTKKMVLIK